LSVNRTPPGERRRVVVTGIGCVTPLGADAEATWAAAGEVRSELDLSDLAAKEVRRLDRFIALALVSAGEAVANAGLDLDSAAAERAGVAIGTGIGGLETLERAVVTLVRDGPRRVHPFTIPMTICNMASGYVAIRTGWRGPNLCPVGACASGAQALGEAVRTIERGDADVMLAGGAEAPVTAVGLAGYANMKALSTRNEAPEAASRPFDAGRDGFVMAEGAAAFVLESEEHAARRGAQPRARVLGYAASADAAHIAQPTEDGEGAQRCMRKALADAGIAPEAVDYLNPHATGTPVGDRSEARAIRAVFGAHTDQLPVSATKSMTGHMLGAAGALEALLCVRALETGILPPTINLDHPDPECELDHVANKARQARCQVAVSNSFGFGGTNASLVLGR
jgi:3-oxoacyl-[acyl-carrier-protein] synthase II